MRHASTARARLARASTRSQKIPSFASRGRLVSPDVASVRFARVIAHPSHPIDVVIGWMPFGCRHRVVTAPRGRRRMLRARTVTSPRVTWAIDVRARTRTCGDDAAERGGRRRDASGGDDRERGRGGGGAVEASMRARYERSDDGERGEGCEEGVGGAGGAATGDEVGERGVRGGVDETSDASYDVVAVELEHVKTGAKHLHAGADDSNSGFNVAFRTTPRDSTGVAHVLEHTVLCGSEKFPVRDPFFNMLRRSLSTFMNAMTASDFTCYPFSTMNRTDYKNLLDVYLDAAFSRDCRPLDFSQEGHRFEFSKMDDPTSDLIYKGIVFNEMKGAMGSQASRYSRALGEHLFPTSRTWNSSFRSHQHSGSHVRSVEGVPRGALSSVERQILHVR